MNDFYQIASESGASQDAFEFAKLMELVSAIKPQVVVEIGVDTGRSLAAFNTAFKPRRILGINDVMDRWDPGEPDVGLHNVVIVGDSHDPETKARLDRRLEGDLIDFLFIDGDHTLAGVTGDFEMYGSLVRPGGIIAFHDIMRDPARVPHHAGVDCRAFFDSIKHRFANIEIWNGTAGDAGPGIGVIFL